jgi:hypothetical protein
MTTLTSSKTDQQLQQDVIEELKFDSQVQVNTRSKRPRTPCAGFTVFAQWQTTLRSESRAYGPTRI